MVMHGPCLDRPQRICMAWLPIDVYCYIDVYQRCISACRAAVCCCQPAPGATVKCCVFFCCWCPTCRYVCSSSLMDTIIFVPSDRPCGLLLYVDLNWLCASAGPRGLTRPLIGSINQEGRGLYPDRASHVATRGPSVLNQRQLAATDIFTLSTMKGAEEYRT